MTPTTQHDATDETSILSRSTEIARVAIKHGGREFAESVGLSRFLPGSVGAMTERQAAGQLASDLESLGPTFIKFGQLLSTRSDLLPPAYLEELSRLQDRVAPMSIEDVEEVVEAELGARLSTLYPSFDPTPIGSASLGQVHAAITRSGRPVAVKVQRPGVKRVIETDLKILHGVASFMDRRTDMGRTYRMEEILDQFERTLLQELDYTAEARHLRRIGESLKEFPDILLPEPVEDYCTSRVLTMDYVSGRKASRLSPLAASEVNGPRLADTLLQAYLKQVFVDGFFHADPHPGNVLLIDADRLALIDLGMVGTLSPYLRRKALQLLPAVLNSDLHKVIELAMEIGESDERFDRSALRRRYGALLSDVQAGNLERLHISRMLFDIVRVSAESGLHLPSEMATLGRTLMHLDRIGRILAPGFDFNAAIRKHLTSIAGRQMLEDVRPEGWFAILSDVKELAGELPRRVNTALNDLLARRLGVRVDIVVDDPLLESFQKIANRITLGLVIAALITGAALLMQVPTRFQLFGYPGLAMVCFAGAFLGGVALALSILSSDSRGRRRRHGHPR